MLQPPDLTMMIGSGQIISDVGIIQTIKKPMHMTIEFFCEQK